MWKITAKSATKTTTDFAHEIFKAQKGMKQRLLIVVVDVFIIFVVVIFEEDEGKKEKQLQSRKIEIPSLSCFVSFQICQGSNSTQWPPIQCFPQTCENHRP